MHVEVKFAIPDDEVLGRLADVPALAGLDLSPARSRRDDDLFLDTDDRRLLLARHALRLRRSDGALTLTLARLVKPESGGLLRRDELDGTLYPAGIRSLVDSGFTSVDHVEPDALHRKLAGMVRGASVRRILAIRQDRLIRAALRSGEEVAALDLVVVAVPSLEGSPTWREASLLLPPSGSGADLERIAGVLRIQWKLQPRAVSTFEHALSLVEEAG